MIPIAQMNQRLAAALAGVSLPTEIVNLRRARGRVLATNQSSRLDLPPFDKSAMDGYAILAEDERESYRLLGTVAAGRAAAFTLASGTTVKVMTGAPVPEGAGRVVMQEQTEPRDASIAVSRHDGAVNICWKGEDVRRGEIIVRAGTRLHALEIANLTACGITGVEVVRPVRLAILSTGDEVVAHPDQLTPGKIIDTNAPLLEALADAHGLEVASVARISDDRDAVAQAIRSGVDAADIVVLSGGISVGEFDYVHDALADLGIREIFAGVAIKPGRPLTCAQTSNREIVVALPGNPVAVYLTFHLCLLRIAALLCGMDPDLHELNLELGRDFARRKTERQEYVPARLSPAGTLLPVEYHGTAHLTALMHADGFLIIPSGLAQVSAGAPVRFLPLRGAVSNV